MEAIHGFQDERAPQSVAFGTRSIACRCQFAGGAACRCLFAVPLADVCLQVEHYFSDKNLATDDLFRKEMIANGGWLTMDVLLRCNRIKSMDASKKHILSALVGSDLEIKPDGSAVRRPGNAPLPPLLAKVAPPCQVPQRAPRHVHGAAVAQGFTRARVFASIGPQVGCNHSDFHAQVLTSHSSDDNLFNVGVGGMTGNVWAKAKHKSGCREVQDALSNGDNQSRAAIASELRGHVWEAVESPNANHVLQKCIVDLPPDSLQPILDELVSEKGAATRLAKHKYGCRVFERILEHCRPEQVQYMASEVLMDFDSLARDIYGNYVLQHLFEFGTEIIQRQLATSLVKHMPRLYADPRAAAVIAKALELAAAEEKRSIARALLQAPGRFVQMAAQRFGQAAAVAVLNSPGQEAIEARRLLLHGKEKLTTSRHGRAVLKCVKGEHLQRFAANGGA